MWHWQPNTMMIQRRAGGFRRVPTRSGRPPSRPLNWDNVRVTRALGLEACRVATRTATCCTGNQTPSGTRAQIVTRRGDPDFLSHTLARAGPGENRMKSHWIALAAAALCAQATPLHAHHGVAAYDMTTLTSVTGTVRELPEHWRRLQRWRARRRA